jgi:hypothetical protein
MDYLNVDCVMQGSDQTFPLEFITLCDTNLAFRDSAVFSLFEIGRENRMSQSPSQIPPFSISRQLRAGRGTDVLVGISTVYFDSTAVVVGRFLEL